MTTGPVGDPGNSWAPWGTASGMRALLWGFVISAIVLVGLAVVFFVRGKTAVGGLLLAILAGTLLLMAFGKWAGRAR